MKITINSKIKLHPIEIRKDKKNYIVEDLLTNEFFEMPEVCVVAIHKITDGYHLGEIEKELKSQFPEEDINIVGFAEQLVELELVDEVDGILIEVNVGMKEKLGFSRISPKIGKIFFNQTTKLGYSILFLLNLTLFIFNPHLFPHFKDVFIFDFMFQNVIVWVVVGVILVLIHEAGHILAIRAQGLPTKLEIGHRLFFIVLETDLSLSWKLSSKDRVFLYLAGMCLDQLILFMALIAQLLLPNSPTIFLSVMAFIVLDVIMRLIYQCCVFMKTDLYYVLENLTGCHNLMENAKGLMFRRKNETAIFEGERSTIYLYTVFYFIGLIVSFLLFFFYYIPQLVYTILKIAPGLKSPIHSVTFYDSIFIMLQVVLLLGLLLFSWTKRLRKKSNSIVAHEKNFL